MPSRNFILVSGAFGIKVMVQVISQKFIALLTQCEGCGALLSYQTNDIYEGHFIYCPVCKYKQRVNLELAYDGVVKDGKVKN